MADIKLLTTKEAIEKRRSIRKFKPDAVPDEYIIELLESARWAPSECNTQPWRFKVVKDESTKRQLAEAAFNQKFIANAPVVLVCCTGIQSYIDKTVATALDTNKTRNRNSDMLLDRAGFIMSGDVGETGSRISANVAVAIEHIVLRALDYGLGTCWITMIDGARIKQIFDWTDDIFVFALILIGYPAEKPKKTRRLPLKRLIVE